MTSAIDPTKPEEGFALTQDVRDNFQSAKDEIEQNQTDITTNASNISSNTAAIIINSDDITDNAAAISVIVPASNKNYIINPTFSINQRGFAGGALANEAYGFDRWKAGGASDMTLAGSILTVVSGTAIQIIEDMGYTGDVTVSWVGTGTINGNTSPYTFTKASGNDAITLAVGTYSEIKFETGANATPFEYPANDGAELAKCQRYYQIHTGAFDFLRIRIDAASSANKDVRFPFSYPSMRPNPTAIITGDTGFISGPNVDNVSVNSLRIHGAAELNIIAFVTSIELDSEL